MIDLPLDDLVCMRSCESMEIRVELKKEGNRKAIRS